MRITYGYVVKNNSYGITESESTRLKCLRSQLCERKMGSQKGFGNPVVRSINAADRGLASKGYFIAERSQHPFVRREIRSWFRG